MKVSIMQGVWMMSMFLFFLSGVNGDNRKSTPLPFHESFQKDALDPAWSRIVSSEGSSLEIKEGWLKIDAVENSQDHIQRILEVDNVTISAKIKWVGSIHVVWDKNNWCSVGKICPTPFGRFYSTITSGGKSVELDHRGCFVDFPHLVRIQLGKNCVRFEHSFDGKNWIFLRTQERPAGYRGAPQILLAGKHYSPEQSDFLTSKTLSIKGYPGSKYGGWITDIKIEKTPENVWFMSESERKKMDLAAKSDPFGNEVLQGKGDPVFEEVAKYYPPMRYPREVVGVPEHALDIGVNYLGQLDVSPWEAPRGWFEIGEPSFPFGVETSPITRRLLEGWLPILTLKTQHNDMELEETVFG
ncbi:hypothetical protein JW926_13625, partial [Candidatus Sumerlaeota bacterium]|nr:hypothetical protein [Candidatus Sumerlaeota bacterium]